MADGHWGFYFLAIMNNTALNIRIQVLCEHMFPFLLGIYLGVETLVIL